MPEGISCFKHRVADFLLCPERNDRIDLFETHFAENSPIADHMNDHERKKHNRHTDKQQIYHRIPPLLKSVTIDYTNYFLIANGGNRISIQMD